jgi:hypothetical protein
LIFARSCARAWSAISISEISGEPISFERLRAVPWARYDSDEDPRL